MINKIIGIYRIVNKTNGKSYIGQSIDIETRWKRHLYNSKNERKGKSYAIHHALKLYGIDNFVFEILESGMEPDQLNCREIYYIDLYKSFWEDGGYNLTRGGDSGYEISQETKDKIRKAHLGIPLSQEQKEKIGKAHQGMKRLVETGQRISKALSGKSRPSMQGKPSGMAGKHHSTNTRIKISIANKGKHKSGGRRRPMTEEEKQKTYTSEVRQRMSDAHKGLPPNTGWHHSDEAKKKMSEAKKGRPATNLGITRTEEMKTRDRIINLKRYLNRGKPCIKCIHINLMSELETRYFVSSNETAIQLTGMSGAMSTVQRILDDPNWVSPKPNSKTWQILKSWKIEYCSQSELFQYRSDLIPSAQE
jgi:group I intron endonuclease